MRNKKKILGTALLLSMAFAMSAQAGVWSQDETGYYYLTDDNAYARAQLMEIDGVTYGFNSSAYMMTGWSQLDGNWYYFDPASGAMETGWKDLEGTWYYLDPSTGVMKTSWLKLGTNRYYLDGSGALKVNCFFDAEDGLAYRADENGVIYRNTSTEDGNGNIFVYDSEGRIKIANTSTRAAASVSGGSSFSDEYLTMDNYEEFKANIVTLASEAVQEKEDELYEKYMERKEKGTLSSAKISSWEYTTRNALTKLGLTDDEIDAFIYAVEHGTYVYGGDEEYEDDDDEDYDYDYDYDYYDYDDDED